MVQTRFTTITLKNDGCRWSYWSELLRNHDMFRGIPKHPKAVMSFKSETGNQLVHIVLYVFMVSFRSSYRYVYIYISIYILTLLYILWCIPYYLKIHFPHIPKTENGQKIMILLLRVTYDCICVSFPWSIDGYPRVSTWHYLFELFLVYYLLAGEVKISFNQIMEEWWFNLKSDLPLPRPRTKLLMASLELQWLLGKFDI